MDEKLPRLALCSVLCLVFQILLSLGQATPNLVVSTDHSSRGPSIGVLLLRFGRRLEAANKKPCQSAWAARPFGIRFSGFGGGKGRWFCCVSMSCFVFRIWYLMGNYHGRNVLSYLLCCACCHGWDPGTGGWGRVTWNGWVCAWAVAFCKMTVMYHNDICCIIFLQRLGCGCGKLLWIDMCLTIHFYQMLQYFLNMSFIQKFCQTCTNCTVFFLPHSVFSLHCFADSLFI